MVVQSRLAKLPDSELEQKGPGVTVDLELPNLVTANRRQCEFLSPNSADAHASYVL